MGCHIDSLHNNSSVLHSADKSSTASCESSSALSRERSDDADAVLDLINTSYLQKKEETGFDNTSKKYNVNTSNPEVFETDF